MRKNGARIETGKDRNFNGQQKPDKRTFSTVRVREGDFVLELADASIWLDMHFCLRGLQMSGRIVENVFSVFGHAQWGIPLEVRGGLLRRSGYYRSDRTVLCQCGAFGSLFVVFLHLSNVDSRGEPP